MLELSGGRLHESSAVRALQQLQLLFDFFEHLEHATLFEDLRRLRQVGLGLSRCILDDVQGTDHLVGLSKVRRAITIQIQFQFLDLFKLLEGHLVPIGFQIQQRDISLDLARASVHLAIVILQDLLGLLQTVECLVKLFTRFLHLG